MNTIYESKNDYMIVKPEEYKVCPVWGHLVYFKHDCDKAHKWHAHARLENVSGIE